MSPSTLNELNSMDLASFVAVFGNLVEYFPVLAACTLQATMVSYSLCIYILDSLGKNVGELS